MEIEARRPTSKGPAKRFTGDVWVDPVTQPRPAPHRMSAGIVRFAPGARTAWHVHALGQTLRVLDGIALVQARGGDPLAVHPGQTIYTPPGEWHWHGATGDTFMTHLALSEAPEDPTPRWSPGVTTSPTPSTSTPTRPSTPDHPPGTRDLTRRLCEPTCRKDTS